MTASSPCKFPPLFHHISSHPSLKKLLLPLHIQAAIPETKESPGHAIPARCMRAVSSFYIYSMRCS